MSAERDLEVLRATLDVARRPGTFTYVTGPPGAAAPPDAQAMVVEDEGVSFVVPRRSDADPRGFAAAWLTLTVHSALDAVGLTAAVSTALAAAGIPANVLAGQLHDHVLVPVERADEAIAVLRDLPPDRRTGY